MLFNKNQQTYAPADLGFAALAIATEQTSEIIQTRGANKITFTLYLDRTAATDLQLKLFYLPDGADPDEDTNWVQTETSAVSGGTVTQTSATFVKAAAADITMDVSLTSLCYSYMRFAVSGTSAGGSDFVTAYVTVGY